MSLYYPRLHSVVMKDDTKFAYTGPAHDLPTNLHVVGYSDHNHTPSWHVYNHGTGLATLRYNAATGWMDLDVEEVSEGGKSSKRTMITLPKEVVDAVREMLNKEEVK